MKENEQHFEHETKRKKIINEIECIRAANRSCNEWIDLCGWCQNNKEKLLFVIATFMFCLLLLNYEHYIMNEHQHQQQQVKTMFSFINYSYKNMMNKKYETKNKKTKGTGVLTTNIWFSKIAQPFGPQFMDVN